VYLKSDNRAIGLGASEASFASTPDERARELDRVLADSEEASWTAGFTTLP